jgi:PAS domain S-box-containing protein
MSDLSHPSHIAWGRPRAFDPEDPLEAVVEYFLSNPDCDTAVLADQNGLVRGVVTRSGVLRFLFQDRDKKIPIRILADQECRAVKKDKLGCGELLRWYQADFGDIIVLDDEGRYHAHLSCRDVLHLLKLELDAVEERYRVILDSIRHGIIVIDKQARIVFINKAASSFLQCDPAEGLGQPITSVVPNTRLPEVLESGRPLFNEKHRIGSKVVITDRLPIMQGPEVVGAVAIFQDITAEEELLSQLTDVKELVKIMEVVLDNSYVGIIFCDSEGIIRFMNRMYEELLGVDRQTAVGQHITKYFPDSRLPIVIRTGEPELGWVYNFRGQKLVLNRIPIKRGGKVVGAIAQCIFRDLSELKKLAAKVEVLERKAIRYRRELNSLLAHKYGLDDFVGESESIKALKQLVSLYARTDCPILILGETGTGKELLAHAIHDCSGRSNGPFVCINSASIVEGLLEAELFGYVRGAFTGAHPGGKIGKVELADGGTLFLDEIGDLSLDAQAKLLRVLEEKRVERVGGIHPIEVNFRLVAATNKDLEKMMKEGKFREDLYYRLATITLFVPPLRSRPEDIPLLVTHFLRRLSGRELRVSEQALEALKRYRWPGNVRELKSVMERAVSLLGQDEDEVLLIHLPSYILQDAWGGDPREGPFPSFLKKTLDDEEQEAILKALRACQGNRVRCAKLLGISRSALYRKMKKFGISS